MVLDAFTRENDALCARTKPAINRRQPIVVRSFAFIVEGSFIVKAFDCPEFGVAAMVGCMIEKNF